MPKVTIKPSATLFGQFDVLVDGNLAGSYWFERNRSDRGGRVEVQCAGRLTDNRNGQEFDLSYYAWAADARRAVKAHFEEEID